MGARNPCNNDRAVVTAALERLGRRESVDVLIAAGVNIAAMAARLRDNSLSDRDFISLLETAAAGGARTVNQLTERATIVLGVPDWLTALWRFASRV